MARGKGQIPGAGFVGLIRLKKRKHILAKLFLSLELADFDPAFRPQILEPQRVTGKFLRNKDLDAIINSRADSFGEPSSDSEAVEGKVRCHKNEEEKFAGAASC